MTTFAYWGRRGGELVKGRLEATSSENVASRLSEMGIVPVEIALTRESSSVLDGLRARLARRSVELDDLMLFARQMHAMSRAGLPLLRAMRAIMTTTHHPALTEALREVCDDLETGRSFAVALRKHEEIFSPVFVSSVAMGEETGRLEEAFEQLAAYLEVERDTRMRVKGAMRYPLIVIGAIGIAIGVLNVFALPVFAEIFSEFGTDLPWPTRLLIGSSEFITAYWPHMLVSSAVAIGIAWRWLKTEDGRLHWHQTKLRIPLTGSILSRAAMARFARSFSLALRSGVSLLRGIRVSASVVDNDWLAARFIELQDRIERGESLTRTATASGLFPPLVLQMIAVGEETGSLDDLLFEVARYYEAEVEYELKRLAESIEPILIVAIGALVLLLALGVYLPMWDLATAARGG